MLSGPAGWFICDGMMRRGNSPPPEAVATMQHDLRTAELDYDLPAHLIAKRPAEPRDSARMMALRADGSIEHRRVSDLPEYLRPGDALVFNNTAVVPARLAARRAALGTGGRVEGLFLEERADSAWIVMLRSGGRLREGERLALILPGGEDSGFTMELTGREGAQWVARVAPQQPEKGGPAGAVLDVIGRTPLPPYILKARGEVEHWRDELDREWYQTIYADPARRHSVAAPTAGLHFTPALLRALDEQGVERLEVTLHVGAGTFKPVSAERLAEHEMHIERFEVGAAALERLKAIHAARPSGGTRVGASGGESGGGRLFAVGTTAVRTLESLPEDWRGRTGPIIGETKLMVAPPFEFRFVDGLLTNFHLPRSTLLALVAAKVGLERLKAAYAEAVRQGYRFYSYGDAMLIEPGC